MKDYFVYSLISTIPVNDFTLESGCKYSIDAFKPFYIGKGNIDTGNRLFRVKA